MTYLYDVNKDKNYKRPSREDLTEDEIAALSETYSIKERKEIVYDWSFGQIEQALREEFKKCKGVATLKSAFLNRANLLCGRCVQNSKRLVKGFDNDIEYREWKQEQRMLGRMVKKLVEEGDY